MNIGIYDTQHFETTYALIRILDLPENKITLFITPAVAATLQELLQQDASQYQWIIKEKTNPHFIYKIYCCCKKNHIDVLWLNTTAYHHLLLALLCRFLPKTIKMVTIHDSNGFFKPAFTFKLRAMIRYYGKKALAECATAYSVMLSTTKSYIEEQFHPKQPVFVVPGSVYEQEGLLVAEHPEIMKLVVPGTIDDRRKNYHEVMELLKYLQKSRYKWELVLLGSAYKSSDVEIINKCKGFSSETVRLTYYESDFVEAAEYEQQLEKASFIFLPLQQYTAIEDEIQEEYGVTKNTGSFFDAVRHAKPILLPQRIRIPEELKEQCTVYKNVPELFDFLESIRQETNADLQNNIEAAYKNVLRFTPDRIRHSLYALLK